MNILVFSWRGPKHPESGGAEIVTHNYAKEWVKKGHRVTLFTSLYPQAPRHEMIDGVEIIRYGGQYLTVKLWAVIWYKFMRHQSFDIVLDHFHGIPFFTPFYVKEKKIAFIHEVALEVWKFNPWPYPLNKILNLIGILLEPLIYHFYLSIPFITVSESTRNDLVKLGISQSKITIINNGFNRGDKIPVKRNKMLTVIYLGTQSYDKGILDALKSFSIISLLDSRSTLWIVGKGDMRIEKKIKEETKKIKKGKIVFWGYVSTHKKYQLLKKAHILIHPSAKEGWGLNVIEAASVGTPTVGYNVCGLRDSILPNVTGLITSNNTPYHLAHDIVDLFNDKKRYKFLSTNAKRFSNRFKWSESIKKSLIFLENI